MPPHRSTPHVLCHRAILSKYRVSHLVVHLGWVDLDFECSTVCPFLLGPMRIWQKRLGSWASWWNTQIKVNATQMHDQMRHPVCYCDAVPGW